MSVGLSQVSSNPQAVQLPFVTQGNQQAQARTLERQVIPGRPGAPGRGGVGGMPIKAKERAEKDLEALGDTPPAKNEDGSINMMATLLPLILGVGAAFSGKKNVSRAGQLLAQGAGAYAEGTARGLSQKREEMLKHRKLDIEENALRARKISDAKGRKTQAVNAITSAIEKQRFDGAAAIIIEERGLPPEERSVSDDVLDGFEQDLYLAKMLNESVETVKGGGTVEEALDRFPKRADGSSVLSENSVRTITSRLRQLVDSGEIGVLNLIDAADTHAAVNLVLAQLEPNSDFNLKSIAAHAETRKDDIDRLDQIASDTAFVAKENAKKILLGNLTTMSGFLGKGDYGTKRISEGLADILYSDSRPDPLKDPLLYDKWENEKGVATDKITLAVKNASVYDLADRLVQSVVTAVGADIGRNMASPEVFNNVVQMADRFHDAFIEAAKSRGSEEITNQSNALLSQGSIRIQLNKAQNGTPVGNIKASMDVLMDKLATEGVPTEVRNEVISKARKELERYNASLVSPDDTGSAPIPGSVPDIDVTGVQYNVDVQPK